MANPGLFDHGVLGNDAFSDVAAVWRVRAADGGPRPFFTYRDEAAGGRVELSYATVGNWLAKTANFIQDDLSAEAGDRIALCAPPHWLTAVWALAPLLTGATVDPWGDAKAAHTVVACADDEVLAAGRECPGERLALSLSPLGQPFAVVPDGYRDFTAEVRGHGDRFTGFDPPSAGTPALVVGGETLTHGQLVEAAAESARNADLEAGRPLLVDARADRFTGSDLVTWLFGPLVAGTPVVLVRGAAAGDLDRIAATERATRRVVLE